MRWLCSPEGLGSPADEELTLSGKSQLGTGLCLSFVRFSLFIPLPNPQHFSFWYLYPHLIFFFPALCPFFLLLPSLIHWSSLLSPFLLSPSLHFPHCFSYVCLRVLSRPHTPPHKHKHKHKQPERTVKVCLMKQEISVRKLEQDGWRWVNLDTNKKCCLDLHYNQTTSMLIINP